MWELIEMISKKVEFGCFQFRFRSNFSPTEQCTTHFSVFCCINHKGAEGAQLLKIFESTWSHTLECSTLGCAVTAFMFKNHKWQIACLIRLNTQVFFFIKSNSHIDLNLNKNLRATYFKTSMSDSYRASICRWAQFESNHLNCEATPSAQYTKNDS